MILCHVAFAAHDLDRVINSAIAILTAEHLAHRGLNHDVFVVTIKKSRRHVEHRVHRIDIRRHARDLLLHEIELRNRAIKLVARFRPLARLFERIARGAEHARTQRAAAVVEACERDIETLAFFRQQVLARDLHIGQTNARLPSAANTALRAIAAEDIDARHVRRADERADRFLRLACLWISDLLLSHHSEETSERA